MINVPEKYKKYIGLNDLTKLPEELKRYKCPICHAAGYNTKTCPDCGFPDSILMCILDHTNCHHEITEGVHVCPVCGDYVCPVCGCHDVTVITRVTGYLNDLRGFNAGKEQEVRDRHRVNIGD